MFFPFLLSLFLQFSLYLNSYWWLTELANRSALCRRMRRCYRFCTTKQKNKDKNNQSQYMSGTYRKRWLSMELSIRVSRLLTVNSRFANWRRQVCRLSLWFEVVQWFVATFRPLMIAFLGLLKINFLFL